MYKRQVQGDILTVMCKNDGKINWEWNAPWEDDNEPDQEAYTAYIRYLNDWRKSDLLRPLRYGKMVRPLKISTATYMEKVDRKDLIRVLDEVQTTRFVYEGKDVQIFANFRSKPAVCTVYGADGVLCDAPDAKQGKKLCGDAEIELAPRSVKVLSLIHIYLSQSCATSGVRCFSKMGWAARISVMSGQNCESTSFSAGVVIFTFMCVGLLFGLSLLGTCLLYTSILAPGVGIFLSVYSFMRIGLALEEILNPRMRKGRCV